MKNISTVRKFGVGIASLAMVASMAAPAFAADMPGTADNNRWAGMNRYETAMAVAKNFQSTGTVYVARGDVLVDAITAGSLKGGPLLLVNDDANVQAQVKEVISKLGAYKIVVIGGEKAVSKDAVKAITPDGASVSRIAGKDRFETAANVAEAYKKSGGTLDNVYLANGITMVDALVGGQLQNGVILLTDGSKKLPQATAVELNKLGTGKALYALGGDMAIADSVMQDAAVSQSLLIDSFLKDNQDAITMAAKAEMKVAGYVTLFPGKTVADVVSGSDGSFTPLQKAEMMATAPKISYTYAKKVTTAKLFKVMSEHNVVMADTAANAYAQAKTEEATKGVANFSYTGTTKAVTDADTAKKAYADIDLSASSQPLNDTPGTDFLAKKLSTGEGNLTYTNVEKDWPGQFKPDTTIFDFFAAIGVPTPDKPTDNYQASTPLLKSAQVAFGLAKEQAKKDLNDALNTAYTDDTSARKALMAANENLSRLQSVHVSTGYQRLAGADRYATSVAVAKMAYGNPSVSGRVYFANGMAFADAAVSGMLDNSNFGGPVLLVKKDSVPEEVANYAAASDKAAFIAHDKVIALGGDMVISDKTLKAEADALAPQTEAGKLSITFSAPKLAYTKGVTVVEDSKNATVDVTPTVQNAPSGTTQNFYIEYRKAGTHDWKKSGDIDLGNSKKATVSVAVEKGSYQITVTSDGKTGSDSTTQATVEVRLVGEVVDANNQTVGQPQMSSPVSVLVSAKA